MAKKILIITFLFILSIACAYYNARFVNTKQFKIREEILSDEKINDKADGFLIAYFCDLSLNDFLQEEYLDSIFSTLTDFKPEVILFGGDLIDFDNIPNQDRIDALKERLSSLSASYGKYAVLGDQDHRNEEEMLHLFEECGFKVLNNETALICIDPQTYINITGIDALINGNSEPSQAFQLVNSTYYTIVFSHCPDLFDSLLSYNFDYFLSGHSRGGQVYLPLLSLFDRAYGCRKYFRRKTTKENVTIDISNGLGRIEKDARFLADAEIVLYRLSSQ